MRLISYVLCAIALSYGNQVLAATCFASDFQTLKSCIGNDALIELTADFALQQDQFINIAKVSGLTLLGNGHTITESAERHQAGGYNNRHMMTIVGARDVVIANLALRSPAALHADCRSGGIWYKKEPCQGALGVLYSSGVTLTGLDVSMEKTFHVQVAGSEHVVVENSVFNAAATFNLWTGYAQSRGLVFRANLIQGAGANGIMVSMADDVKVQNNVFLSNHWDVQYLGFGGGQLAFEDPDRAGNLSNIAVTGNHFEGGTSAVSYGIELASFDDAIWYSGVIADNTIENHRASAIKLNARFAKSDLRALTIANNYLSNNHGWDGSQIELNGHAFVDINANIQQRGNARLTAGFDGTEKTCRLNGQPRCAIVIRWTSAGVADPRIYVRRAAYSAPRMLFATQASGSATAVWVDAAGGIFELVSGTHREPLASISVRAVP